MKTPSIHRAQDVENFHTFYLNHNNRVFSLIQQKITRREDALDVAQEVFIHLWNWQVYNLPPNHEAIIMNTCKQKIAKFYRKTKNNPSTQLSLLDSENIVCDDTTIALDKEDKLISIENAIELLSPPIRKRIFIMNKMERISQTKISQEMNISLSTVKFHISQALTFLKKHLNP